MTTHAPIQIATLPDHAGALAASAQAPRLQSLDALRGLTIALMILVNTSGDAAHTYRLLRHSPWNGCTIADVVFPCFLFIVGISLVLSFSGKRRRGVPRRVLLLHALRRALILFALGIAINGFPHFELHTLRIFGVLQRIAVCFLLASVIYLSLSPRTIFWVTLAILFGYWIVLRWVPVPGYGLPGVSVAMLDPHGNLPAWIDRHLLPASHLYHQGFYDPEGLLGSISALACTLVGILTGFRLQRPISPGAKAARLALAGALCVLAGLLWSHWLPLNKRLWTSSFVVFNAGVSLLALSFFLWWLDVEKKATRLAVPMIAFGTNALAAYAFSEFLASFLSTMRAPGSAYSVQQWLFQPVAAVIRQPYIAALTYAVLYVVICYVPVLLLFRRRIFLKV
ncbi:MAG TPA: heparan-alpha-glucosaminide N-acetyltransferase domain-containing protein [Acidobacteriaceae bacterium]|nr:heparan-alpha-glucosaminide N-acetyltransferase domain-containing protein [Acidobacteriaceae bacterium]